MLLLFSNGLHPRATVADADHPGPELFGEFYPTGQGLPATTARPRPPGGLRHRPGDHVIMNKYVYDADGRCSSGTPRATPYGGYLAAVEALRHRHLPLVEHLCPPLCPGDAPAGLRARVHEQRCGTSLTSRVCGWRRRWARNFLLRRRAGYQEPPDRDQLGWARDAARVLEDGGQAHLRPLGRRRSTTSSPSACPPTSTTATVHGHQPHPDDAGPVRPGHPPQAQAHHERPVRVHRVPICDTTSTTSAGPTPGRAVRPVPARLHEHPPRHELVRRRASPPRRGAHPQSTGSPTPSTPSTASP